MTGELRNVGHWTRAEAPEQKAPAKKARDFFFKTQPWLADEFNILAH